MSAPIEFMLDAPPFAGATGRGVRVAIVDSGVFAEHPHVGGVAGGIQILESGTGLDITDRIGHGTAVSAALREKAPDVDLVAVRVFDRTLATTAELLARAIEWAAEDGAHLINVSLGTPNVMHLERLRGAVTAATQAGAWIVSAHSRDGVPMFPGAMLGVIPVAGEATIARDRLTVEDFMHGGMLVRAAPYPRPIPGVPVERNLQGVSFAVANTTGFLARLRESAPGIRDLSQLKQFLLNR